MTFRRRTLPSLPERGPHVGFVQRGETFPHAPVNLPLGSTERVRVQRPTLLVARNMREDVKGFYLRLYYAAGDPQPERPEGWVPAWREAIYLPSAGNWWIRAESDASGAVQFLQLDAPEDLDPAAWRQGGYGQANQIGIPGPYQVAIVGGAAAITLLETAETVSLASLYLRCSGNPIRVACGFNANGVRGYVVNNNDVLELDRQQLPIARVTAYAGLNSTLVVMRRDVVLAT